jgi:hypothetical protein
MGGEVLPSVLAGLATEQDGTLRGIVPTTSTNVPDSAVLLRFPFWNPTNVFARLSDSSERHSWHQIRR